MTDVIEWLNSDESMGWRMDTITPIRYSVWAWEKDDSDEWDKSARWPCPYPGHEL